jgi:hypothetical protein
MTQLSALSWKEMTLLVLVWVGTGLESNALAHADKLQMLQIHTPHLLAKVRVDEPARVAQITGVKTWVSNHTVKGKVYFVDGSTIQYTCVEEGAEGPAQPVVCHQD